MFGLVDGNNFFVSCERVFDRSLVGRPVAVLSNNDGCCVARSNEFKALGIKMGTPYFELKSREKSGELVFRSSNYELYGDMSRRIISILKEDALDVEQYSIDEAFIVPPHNQEIDLLAYGRRLRGKVLRWVGIPCGVGFAPTKTLAKIANHIAKKLPDGVYILPNDPTEILSSLPSEEVWGVGRRLPAKLRAERIHSARDLRDAPDEVVRSVGGITLLRTAMELRGIPCIDDRAYDADPDSVSCSRSFGEPATTKEALGESLASFISQAAVKLRKHRLLAAGCNIYAQLFRSGGRSVTPQWTLEGDADAIGRTVMFPEPTDATNVMLNAIHGEVDALYVPGVRYRKTGVVFFGLEKAGAIRQPTFFDAAPPREQSKLYKTIDALNRKFGSAKLFSAAEGIGKKSWHMKRSKLSRRATTNWDEIIKVK